MQTYFVGIFNIFVSFNIFDVHNACTTSLLTQHPFLSLDFTATSTGSSFFHRSTTITCICRCGVWWILRRALSHFSINKFSWYCRRWCVCQSRKHTAEKNISIHKHRFIFDHHSLYSKPGQHKRVAYFKHLVFNQNALLGEEVCHRLKKGHSLNDLLCSQIEICLK